MVALSFADSDLAALASAWKHNRENLPELRLAPLRDLRHPMSVDLWIDRIAAHAKIIVVRLLGGYEWWSYGCDRLSEIARQKGIQLALLPGECRESDARLIERSTIPPKELEELLGCFREGGPDNMGTLLSRLAAINGTGEKPSAAKPLDRAGFYLPGTGTVSMSDFFEITGDSRHVIPILFYRSMLLAGDVEPIDALYRTLRAKNLCPVPIFVSSLKSPDVACFVEQASKQLNAVAIVTTTAFSAGQPAESGPLFDRINLPVFQAIVATTHRDAWLEGQRGLVPSDLAMHVVLPELDGRVLAGAISFKDTPEDIDELGLRLQVNRPEPDRIEQIADRMSAFFTLRDTPPAERRVIILLPDYPGAEGRTGYAVGLDVPASVIAILHDLRDAGYRVDDIPEHPRELISLLSNPSRSVTSATYDRMFKKMPDGVRERVNATWGETPRNFEFRSAQFGNITVALAPDRGKSEDRRADYHDPVLPPRHELLAFGYWLKQQLRCQAIIHVGAHGTLEWLPGKTVALSSDCFPEIVTGGLPVIYPFIVSNPGEAAQAKRRIAAVTLGHLPPPMTAAGLDSHQMDLERLVDEYAQADGLDHRRRDRLAKLIVETADKTGLAAEAGVTALDDADSALLQIDSWLCDLKDFAIKDGLHVFGRITDEEGDQARNESAMNERQALLDALDGKFISPGPSGAPARGRLDVLPTGRNMFASDPRTMPTPTAFDLGRASSEAVVRGHVQKHGDWPRALVIDLWGSASLRTGGEEIAQGLALMGCRPQWDAATGRVTGIEVLPPAVIGRPRIDVTWRISGLFRDMFPAQIALMDAAIAAIAARDEPDEENPLAAERRQSGRHPARIFGSSPGVYGTGIEDMIQSGKWDQREEIGRAYLEGTSHAYGGVDGLGQEMPDAFSERVSEAELLIHTGDDPGRDILEGSAEVAFIGGFSAAVAALGGKADIVALDTTDPGRPRARSLAEAVTRVVRARATNPRFIAGQLRHGPRGGAEFAETVDRLIGFAETTEAIPGNLIDAVHDAYLGDPDVREFLLRENPAAARAIAERFASARRRGLWHPLRNSVDSDLEALVAEANALEPVL